MTSELFQNVNQAAGTLWCYFSPMFLHSFRDSVCVCVFGKKIGLISTHCESDVFHGMAWKSSRTIFDARPGLLVYFLVKIMFIFLFFCCILFCFLNLLSCPCTCIFYLNENWQEVPFLDVFVKIKTIYSVFICIHLLYCSQMKVHSVRTQTIRCFF